MRRELIRTSDGSTGLYIVDLQRTYHPKHGALQETLRVFIQNGLQLSRQQAVGILEIGFGTRLNALVTYLRHTDLNLSIRYETVEAYPLSWEEALLMNFSSVLNAPALPPIFEQMHTCAWGEPIALSPALSFKKRLQRFEEIDDPAFFDLICFDAFGVQVQPEPWEVSILQRIYNALKPNGYLAIYAAKGSVRRAMQACGFGVERLSGPPMKREMLRVRKG